MAKGVFRHQDDDGQLSVFTSGNSVLIVCEHGHYWVIEAEQKTSHSIKADLATAGARMEVTELLRSLE